MKACPARSARVSWKGALLAAVGMGTAPCHAVVCVNTQDRAIIEAAVAPKSAAVAVFKSADGTHLAGRPRCGWCRQHGASQQQQDERGARMSSLRHSAPLSPRHGCEANSGQRNSIKAAR